MAGTETTPRNKFAVGLQGDNVMVMFPVPQRLAKADALNLAAWIVVLAAAEDEEEWEKMLEAVRNT
jgi:class 3 adenylate cyclase